MSLEHGRRTEIGSRARSGDRLLPWPEVERIVPYSRQHVARLERAGKFPTRVQCGAARIAWWESEILEWAGALPRGTLTLNRQSGEAA
jgi:prophage regulatory protein